MKFRLYHNGKLNCEHPADTNCRETHVKRLFANSVAQFPKDNWELVIRDAEGLEYHMRSHKPGKSSDAS